jgi:hypothetical protein
MTSLLTQNTPGVKCVIVSEPVAGATPWKLLDEKFTARGAEDAEKGIL